MSEQENGSKTNTRSSRQELKNRLVDMIPGMGVLSHMIGLEHIRNIFHGSRQRANDAHKMQSAVLRGDKPPEPEPIEDNVGDMSVIGEQHYHPLPAPPVAKAGKLAWTLAIAGLLGSAGMGGFLLNQYLSPAKPGPTSPGASTTIEKTEGFLIKLPDRE